MRFKNYRNPYTNDNRIYSFKDLYDMPFGEVIRNKQEVLGQYRVLGVPIEQELQGSENVIWVDTYTRDDGTEVKGHWRSKPEGSGVNNEDKNENSTGGAASVNSMQNTKNEKTPVLEATITKEEKLYPKEIAGVKRGAPMTKEQAGGKNVNPNYDNGDIGYKVNCSYCSVVYKARQLGYDLEALPVRDSDTQDGKLLQKYPYYAYENIDGTNVERPTKIRSNDAEECLQNIEKQVEANEEYIMWYQPNEGSDKLAHVVNVSRNDKNELEFYDSQSGKTYGKEYIDRMNFKKTTENKIYYFPQFLFRVDDKVVKPKVLNKIARPSQ